MTAILAQLGKKLKESEDLAPEEVDSAVESLADERVSDGEKASFLTALHEKGESPGEIAAFASAFRSRASSPGAGVLGMAGDAIDFVGTGGDRSGAFNISTTVSFILASAGVRVIKHGNRGATSKSGSADLLESLGFPLEAGPAVLEESLRELNFCFLFARSYHPAYKAIVPVRTALAEKGQRTVFNLLGPLINPARPGYQVMGVYGRHLVEPVAGAMGKLGILRGLAVHGEVDGGHAMDKLTTAGRNHVRGVGEWDGFVATWNPEEFGLERGRLEDLRGGDAGENLAILDAILDNRAPPALQGTILFNAAAGLWVMNKSKSLGEGIDLAGDLLGSGRVKQWMERARKFYRERISCTENLPQG